MTNKKRKFRKARELRKYGIPFGVARKLANDLVRYGYIFRSDLESEGVTKQIERCGDGCCDFSRIVVNTSKARLTFDNSMQLISEELLGP